METELQKTIDRIAELEAEIQEERKLMDNTIVKKWSIFYKGISNDKMIKVAKTTTFVDNYDFGSKLFTGTQKEVYDFVDILEAKTDAFNLKDIREF